VREVSRTLGDHVHANEPLAVIESRELAEAAANLFATRSKAELAQKQFEREESLWQKKVSSEQDYLTAKQAATEAAAELRAAEQKLVLLGLDPRTMAEQPPGNRGAIRVPVVAPFEGSIIEKHIATGDQVTDQTALFRIANLERVWVIASVFEKDIGNVAIGQRATVTLRAYPEREFEGQITWVSDVIEESTRTLKVRVELDNPDKLLKPGSFARVSLRVASKDGAVAVPDSAIQRQKSQPIVFVDAGGGLYKRREVKLGSHSENNVEVTGGLEPGETVVTSGSFLLKSELEKSSFAESE
jgi:cobalt-zinc-cadmium efflux system membrane fusion protein